MDSERLPRKLAVILYADVAGYSRLTGEDEEGTHRRLRACLDAATESIRAHRGHVCHYAGDAILADFASVISAISCAISMQAELHRSNQGLPESRQLKFRIGLNLGEVIIDGEEIYGDGVNIAARLEALAAPGGICVSEKVWAEAKDRTDLAFEDLGEVSVKNIRRPVRAFGVRMDMHSAGERDTTPLASRAEEKPSVAVLPLESMSADPQQGFFADGLTEDIITELSRFPNLFVIARHSCFAYKGKRTTVQNVGRELGARYIVEGSVRRASDRLRLTVQLVDSVEGTHIWANRYDRQSTGMFDLQDELTQAIVSTVSGRLERVAIERVKRKLPDDMAAYDYLLKAKLLHHQQTREANEEALRLLDKALGLDPEFAHAYAWRACTLGQALGMGWGDARELYRRAVESVRTGLSLDENDIECHRILCEMYMEERKWEQAEIHHERAIALNPNDSRIVAQRGELLTWVGRPEEGTECVERAMRLDPFNKGAFAHLWGRALYACRRYDEALRAYHLIASPRYRQVADMAACSAQSGDMGGAKAKVAHVLAVHPEFSITQYLRNLPYKRESDREHHREGLRKAGLPE